LDEAFDFRSGDPLGHFLSLQLRLSAKTSADDGMGASPT
jgi:hypothetical protein